MKMMKMASVGTFFEVVKQLRVQPKVVVSSTSPLVAPHAAMLTP
jgi:hypothetical protein